MTTYIEQGTIGHGGVHNPDRAVGDNWERRFVSTEPNADGNYIVIDEIGYAAWNDIPLEDVQPPYFVELVTEIIECTDPDDPGSTEVDSEYHYDSSAFEYDTVEEADRAARNLIAALNADYYG